MEKLEGTLAVEFGTVERVKWHLDNWSRWMRSGQGVEGLPHASSGVSGGGSSQHFDDMVQDSDRRCARIVDTIVDDLPVTQQAAIHHRYLRSVYRFPRENFALLLSEAKRKVGLGLKVRGVW